MTTYIVHLDPVYYNDHEAGVLYSGRDKQAADAVLEASKKLGHRVEMTTQPDPTYGLSERQIDDLVNQLADIFHDTISDSIYDIVIDGYIGLCDYSLEDLIQEAEEYLAEDDNNIKTIVETYRANRAVEEQLLS